MRSFDIRSGTAADGANRWDKRTSFPADTITGFAPDLPGTQETLAFRRDFLADMPTGIAAFGAGRDDGKHGGETALFHRTARFEKLDAGHFWLSETPESVGSRGWDAAPPRTATWVKLKGRTVPGAPSVLFLDAHFDHKGAKARLEAARLVRAKAIRLGAGCRVVVTGDCNAGDGSEPHAALFGKTDDRPAPLVDTLRAAHRTRGKAEGTFSGFRADATGGARIDWVAASRDWAVVEAGIDRTARDGRTPSDPFPVTAVLRAAGGKD